MSYKDLKDEAYEANMLLPKSQMVIFTFGNVSCADQSQAIFAIKPSGVPYAELKANQMVIVDFEGNVVESKFRPSSDTLTHAVLYQHWEGISGIAHTHSTFATSWAQALRDIPIYGTTHADHFAGSIPCVPPLPDEKIKSNYEYETGIQILNYFESNHLHYNELEMILLGSHAPFTWGVSAEKAVHNSVLLEYIAQMAYVTEQINPNAALLKNSLIKKHYNRKHGKYKYYGQDE
ncbi:MAG TPA: L-ribulose-5-phosphate 4-epimerase AraD [Saprospiraceae bacterium]|nr:L-ribulose-5-phosphate 4-epimerase AraD [Saprospiraceae bacterium]